MNFSLIAGHRHNIERLKKMLKTGRIPHGILFTGPEGIGKRLAAVSLAAALNCGDKKEDGGCGLCGSCKKLRTGNHPTVRFVGSPKNEKEMVAKYSADEKVKLKNINAIKQTGADGQSESSSNKTVKINIDQIREVKKEAFLKSYKTLKKVFIIDDAAAASRAALNCLLKILEEPPENTYFFLVTSSGDLLPATIISRCQEYRFSPLTDSEMNDFLSLRPDLKDNIKDPAKEIKISAGSPGKLVKYSQVGNIKIGSMKSEKFFKDIKKWMGDKPESLSKLNIMLQIEGYEFRKTPTEKRFYRMKIIEETIASLNKNANRELAISNMFLKLGQLK